MPAQGVDNPARVARETLAQVLDDGRDAQWIGRRSPILATLAELRRLAGDRLKEIVVVGPVPSHDGRGVVVEFGPAADEPEPRPTIASWMKQRRTEHSFVIDFDDDTVTRD